MSADEQRRGGIKLLCPVCHKKLQQNIKFDSTERFEKLAAACKQLGFDDEAAIYYKLIADAKKSGIKARNPSARSATNSTANSAANSSANSRVNNRIAAA